MKRPSFAASIFALSLAIILPIILERTYSWGIKHDYIHYVRHWEEMWESFFPSSFPDARTRLYAYGPVYLFLAPIWALHPMAPKLLFAFVWWALGTAYIYASLKFLQSARVGLFLFIAFFATPFFWQEIARYGHFDIVVGAATLGAIIFARNERDISAGAALAFGFLFKFIPLVILPFLCVHNGKVRSKLLASFLVCSVIGYGIVYPVLDQPILASAKYIETRTQDGPRQSKMLSIFRSLEGSNGISSPLGTPWHKFSLPLIAISGALIFLLFLQRRIGQVAACVTVLLSTFSFYKVGHPQFYTVLYSIVPYWYFFDRSSKPPSKAAASFLLIHFIFLTCFVEAYVRTNGLRPPYTVREWIGYPNFALSCTIIVLMLLQQNRVRAPRLAKDGCNE